MRTITAVLLISAGPLFSQDLDSYRLGLSSFKDGFYDLSEESFLEFIEENPGSVYTDKARYYLGISLIKQAKFQEAVEVFRELADKNQFSHITNTRYFLVIAAFMTGDYGLSNKYCLLLSGALEDQAKREKVAFIQIQNHINLGNKDKALELSTVYFENSLYTLYRTDILKYLINYFLETEDYGDAVQTLEMLFLEEPGSDEEHKILYQNYLAALRELGEYDKAELFFEKNCTSYYNTQLYLLVSDIYYLNNRKNQALELLEKVQKEESSIEAARKAAVIYIELNQYDRAITTLAARKDNPEIAQIIGDLYYRMDDKQNSYQTFSAVPFDKLDRVSFIQLLQLALDLKKTSTLELYYSNLDRFDTISGDERNSLLYKLAEAFFNSRSFDKTARLLSKWSSEFVDDEKYDAVLYMQGLCYYKAGKYDQGLLSFSKLEAMNKKDSLYYEAFVDKGEIYFSLKEYRSAIENYKKYLNNRVSHNRKKECLLQLANAYYNIKQYNMAYKTFAEYEVKWGVSESVSDKVGHTLLKAQNYQEIVKYYTQKKHLNDFARYLVIYSCYKLEDYKQLSDHSVEYLKKDSSPYFYDMLYLSILAYSKQKAFDVLYSSYKNHYPALTRDENQISEKKPIITMIKHEYFKAFLKIRKLSEALALFENQDDDETLLFVAENLYKHLYLDQSLAMVEKYKNREILETLEPGKILFFIEASVTALRYDDALFYLYYLQDKEKDNLITGREIFDIIIRKDDSQSFAEFYNNYKKGDPEINKVLETVKEYYDSNDKSRYKKKAVTLLNRMNINNKVTQTILYHLVYLEYADQNYKEVIKLITSIPAKKLSTLSPEFKYMEASSYLALEKESKAVKEYLKIFYMYSYEIYWIEKSIRQILDVYEKNGQTDKQQKLKKMFEDKYFVLP